MKVYILIDSENNVTSCFFDPCTAATELELEDGFDISKIQYCKYENEKITYSKERETTLKRQEADYIANCTSQPTLEQKNRADIDYIGMMTGVL